MLHISEFQFTKRKPYSDGSEVSRITSRKVPFFENLKANNPKYSLTSCNCTTARNRNSETIHNDKLTAWTGGFKLDLNKNDLKTEGVESDPKNNLNSTEYSYNSSQSGEFTPDHNISNDSTTDGDADAFNDDIVIFERTDFMCPKAHQVEKVEEVTKVKVSKSSKTKKRLLIIVAVTFIIPLVIWSILQLKLEQIFLNYFNVHMRHQPTNYEVSLMFVKNIFRLIVSCIDGCKNVW